MTGPRLYHERGQCPGVDAPGKEYSDGHIRNKVSRNRTLQSLSHLITYICQLEIRLGSLPPNGTDIAPSTWSLDRSLMNPSETASRERTNIPIPSYGLRHTSE